MRQKSILLITTADTDILTAERALSSMSQDSPHVTALNPASLTADPIRDRDDLAREIMALAFESGVIVLRLLGGRQAMPDTFDELARYCHSKRVPLIACPGHQEWDEALAAACTVSAAEVKTVFAYLMQGGVQNFRNLFLCLSDTYFGTTHGYEAPTPLPWEGIYHPDFGEAIDVESFVSRHFRPGRPSVGILFYRAHWMSGNLAPIDSLIRSLERMGANVLPMFAFSLRHRLDGDEEARRPLTQQLVGPDGLPRVHCIINTMGMSASQPTRRGRAVTSGSSADYLENLNIPIVQAIMSVDTHEAWLNSSVGLGPIDTAMNVALPEFDGRLISVPISFKEQSSLSDSSTFSGRLQRYLPRPDRVDAAARLAIRHADLRRKPNPAKKIAIILGNSPSKDGRIGNAVGLDTPASVVAVLHALKDQGYSVTNIPLDGDDLIHRIIERCSNDREFLTDKQLRLAAGHVNASEFAGWFSDLPREVTRRLTQAWGEPPGEVYRSNGNLAIAGLDLGNVFVGLQPPRGFGENPSAIYHSPDMVPTHHYLAYYRWLRDVFQADAIIHIGKHGTLEWLPGKGIGLSPTCFPDVVLDDVPVFYPFIINDPGEGTQAKRRAHAAIVDHLIPTMTSADSYGDIARIEQLLDEHYQCRTLDPRKLPILETKIWETLHQADLHRDLAVEHPPDDFDQFIQDIDHYLCELKDSPIKDGLHILGESPRGDQLVEMLSALTRLDIGSVPSLRRSVADALGFDYSRLTTALGAPPNSTIPDVLKRMNIEAPVRTNGDVLVRIEQLCRQLYREALERGFQPRESAAVVGSVLGAPDAQTKSVLEHVAQTVYPALMRTPDEIRNLLRGLEGGFIPPGPSGAPTHGMANVLPTGRNFYSLDPKTVPSQVAWETGTQLAESLLARYREEEGKYPEMVGMVVWGTSAMRTHGDDVAQILCLLGVRPVWQPESGRVLGLEPIPLTELGRPRIDVTIRISGFFRDAFPNLINLLDQAVETAASQDESPDDNYVVKHLSEDLTRLEDPPEDSQGETKTVAKYKASNRSLYRIFGSKPGAYGAGILAVLDERNWDSVKDLAEVYTAWSGYAYTRQDHGVSARRQFQQRFKQIAVAAKNQDTREHDIFDSDDYMQFHGGMIATIRALSGRAPRQFMGDSADPARATNRALRHEARRVFRTRVVNPKWIQSMKRHGYKGAFELAATVDYMFGYDATAEIIDDWMYQDVTENYVLETDTQRFFLKSNPWALREMVERLLEAMERGLWSDPQPEIRKQLLQLYLDLDAGFEARQEGPQEP